MKNMMHSMQASCRFGLTAVVCMTGFLVSGMSGCGKKETPVDHDPLILEASPAVVANSSEGWMGMETLGQGKWVAIEGAADLEWADESRVMRIGVGTYLNGVRWTGTLPTVPYVVELEARRMSTENKEEELIRQIRELAGQLGELHHREQEGPSDAEHYDFQVMVGLANATVGITDFAPEKLFYWLGYCIIGLGLDVDPRIRALMDALENEVNVQLDILIEDEKENGLE